MDSMEKENIHLYKNDSSKITEEYLNLVFLKRLSIFQTNNSTRKEFKIKL